MQLVHTKLPVPLVAAHTWRQQARQMHLPLTARALRTHPPCLQDANLPDFTDVIRFEPREVSKFFEVRTNQSIKGGASSASSAAPARTHACIHATTSSKHASLAPCPIPSLAPRPDLCLLPPSASSHTERRARQGHARAARRRDRHGGAGGGPRVHHLHRRHPAGDPRVCARPDARRGHSLRHRLVSAACLRFLGRAGRGGAACSIPACACVLGGQGGTQHHPGAPLLGAGP